MKVEILLLEDKYDLIKKSNYFEQLELDSDQVWQGDITNIFVFIYLKKFIGISNLNDNFHLKEFSLCVHVDFTVSSTVGMMAFSCVMWVQIFCVLVGCGCQETLCYIR